MTILNQLVYDFQNITKQKKFTYHEPFFGAGALYFNLWSREFIKKSYINDINKELVIFYKTIQDSKTLNSLINELEILEDGFNKSKERDVLFFTWRDRFNELLKKNNSKSITNNEKIEISSLLISLNKTCFNGVYRKNKSGEFNVPFSKKFNGEVSFFDKENIKTINKSFENTVIENLSFEKAINFRKIKKNHLIFLDPPYVPISKTSDFSSYYDDGFNDFDHQKLSELLKKIDNVGAYFILTNSNSQKTKDIYLSKNKFFNINVNVRRSINQQGLTNNPDGTQELVITNFKSNRS